MTDSTRDPLGDRPRDGSHDPTRDPGRDLRRGAAGDPDANATVPARRGTIPPGELGRGAARHHRAVGWRSRDVVRTAALVLAMYLALRLLWLANALFLTVFLGVLFAIAISAGVDRLQRFRIPRGVGAALIVIAFLSLLGGFGAWVAPTLRSQGTELRQKLPEAVDRVEEWINRRQNGLLGTLMAITSSGGESPSGSRGGVDRAPPGGTAGTGGAAAGGGAASAPRGAAGAPGGSASAPQAASAPSATATLSARLRSKLGGLSRYLFPFLTSTLAAVSGLLLVIFLSIYLAADPELYRRGALLLFPVRKRKIISVSLDRVAVVLRKWLITQLIAMAVIGTVTTAGLLVLRVKAAFALGILAGLFEFIPTVGPILGAIPAVAMGFLDSPEKALAVALFQMGVQFLENHILIPLLMKGGMNLPPALTILAQALLALLFGFLGLMVAVPLLATVMVIVQVLYIERAPEESTERGKGRAPEERFDADLDEPLYGLPSRVR